jgi:hypothetical protein
MKRAIAMALLASTLLAGLANAQPSSHASAPHEEPDSGSARAIDSPYLAVPVVRAGQLRNYLFVSVRIDIAQGVDLWRTREKAHFLRDALVRASHQNALADPNDDNALNEARAIQVYRAAAIQVLGERAVGPVSIIATYSSRGV